MCAYMLEVMLWKFQTGGVFASRGYTHVFFSSREAFCGVDI